MCSMRGWQQEREPLHPAGRIPFGLCRPLSVSFSLENLIACGVHSSHQLDLCSRVRLVLLK